MNERVTRQIVSTFVLLLTLTGCARANSSDPEQVEQVRAGTLQPGLSQKTLIEAWRLPENVYVKNAKEMIDLGWNSANGGPSFSGKNLYEVWVYTSRNTAVAFRNKQVVAWRPLQAADTAKPK